MKVISNPFDHHKLQYIIECCDQLLPRVLELRLACMLGDIESADAAFSCIRLIGKEIATTRREIATVDDNERTEAA